MAKNLTASVVSVPQGGVPTGTAPCLISFAVDPIGVGAPAPVGTIGSRTDVPSVYQKTGVADTAWTLLAPSFPPGDTLALGDGYSYYANGIDGDLVFDGAATVVGNGYAGLSLAPAGSVYLLTRDIFASNMTVNAGVRVRVGGYRIFVQNRLVVDGAISVNGGNGANGTAGAGGAAGVQEPTNYLYGGRVGIAGPAPTNIASVGLPGTNTHIGGQVGTTAAGANGGTLAGGGGGQNDAGQLGATVNALPNLANPQPAGSLPNLQAWHFFVLHIALTGKLTNSGTLLENGSCGGTGRPSSTGGNGGAGGSGATGGTAIVCARLITGAGSIEAKGGNGGNGGAPNAGGSGGGAGGVLVVATDSLLPLSVALNVSGGIGGASGGHVTATPGGNGGAGIVYKYNP